MTTGTLLFYTGMLVLAAAICLTIVTSIKAPGAKKKIRERMKEKY